jgi:leucyl/phenylalanyl-tRNA--protein transferase
VGSEGTNNINTTGGAGEVGATGDGEGGSARERAAAERASRWAERRKARERVREGAREGGARDGGASDGGAARRFLEDALGMYRQGWFLMAESFDARMRGVRWVTPPTRALVPLDERFHVPSSLGQRVRSGRFVVTTDEAFGAVIRSCAHVGRVSRGEDGVAEPQGTWLHPSIMALFNALHETGHAHSIEAWLEVDVPPGEVVAGEMAERERFDDELGPPVVRRVDGRWFVLVGGLYGLALGAVFCGESMFSRPDLGGTDASKVCLVHLVAHLRERGFEVLDAQLANPHLTRFGMYAVDAAEYAEMLARWSGVERAWTPFDAGAGARLVRAGRR